MGTSRCFDRPSPCETPGDRGEPDRCGVNHPQFKSSETDPRFPVVGPGLAMHNFEFHVGIVVGSEQTGATERQGRFGMPGQEHGPPRRAKTQRELTGRCRWGLINRSAASKFACTANVGRRTDKKCRGPRHFCASRIGTLNWCASVCSLI